MGKKKGADAPTFGQFSWEFYATPNSSDSPDSYQMKCKPTFILSDAFKRQFQLPVKKARHSPTLATAETINFHKLALRYSTSLTKDVLFTAFRDICRKIGELVGNGKEVKLNFGVGTLYSKERKHEFLFDAKALKIENDSSTPVYNMQNPSTIPSVPAPYEPEEVPENNSSTSGGNYDPYSFTNNNFDNEGGGGEPKNNSNSNSNSNSNPNFNSNSNSNSVDDEDFDPAQFGANDVQEKAFQRYIERLEFDAVEENELNQNVQQLIIDRNAAEDLKKLKKKEKAKNLQTMILTEISRKDEVKKKEVVVRREPGRTSAYPLMENSEEGLNAAVEENTRGDQQEDEGAANGSGGIENPFSVPVTRKFLGIPGVPKKGLGFRLSESELLGSLTQQMKAKEERTKVEKTMKLEEEKRYLDHINMEIDFQAYTKQLEILSKKKELMQAWEREAFLKQMQKLRIKGDIEGLRSHKSSSGKLPPLEIEKGESTNRSKMSSMGMEVDPRG